MTRPLYEIAADIKSDWGERTGYAAKPYLEAMADLNKITDVYGADRARDIVAYFLSNAVMWRGAKAREIKAELRAML